jgi:hypothetical protein
MLLGAFSMTRNGNKLNFGYILRIARKDWLKQVFELTRYYTGLARKWQHGLTILFVYRTSEGDAFVGYGVIKEVLSFDELSESEQEICKEHGWKYVLDFAYVVKFNQPVLVKETSLAESKLRGKFLHGVRLDSTLAAFIINRGSIVYG